MKKYGLTILAMVMGFFTMAQDVEEIIKSYCKARGEEKFAKVQSYQMEGIRVRNDVMPVSYYRSRPNKYMMKFDVGDLTAYRTYDGEKGWHTAPWRGVVNPEELPADATVALAGTADFDDQLANWKAKGYKAKLMDDEKVEDKDHYVIELFSTTGFSTLFFIDKETYLLTKIKMVRPRGEQQVTIEVLYSDYRSIEGIMFPFIIEEYTNGYRMVTTELDEVVLNPVLPNDFYNMAQYRVD
ncbi:DUF4292 domain-containing protein [Perlabentimonas gracilis]|uniref:DUF4292 domain-containing protein n=1 Tax=Perlabentimonas gracilis TaxID=2715279 RepID=UPI00140AAD9D|nr:DUF4292 domain-containing protein [Perlabentimonas gracilis]NHB69521.1 outer membrane lipoprotein-sorting protein [Perlabentimonas gracilis]